MKVECPQCRCEYDLDISTLGRKAECAACHSKFIIEEKAIQLTLPVKKDTIDISTASAVKISEPGEPDINCSISGVLSVCAWLGVGLMFIQAGGGCISGRDVSGSVIQIALGVLVLFALAKVTKEKK